MNQTVKKLPLMLGVVGAIAFAAAAPSWAQERGSAAGASAQTGAQTKATGSNAKMSGGGMSGTSGKMSGRAASSEGMKTGNMRTSEKTSHTGMRSSSRHLSS